jgi:hypothetical protein
MFNSLQSIPHRHQNVKSDLPLNLKWCKIRAGLM